MTRIAPFSERYRAAIGDLRLRANLLAFQRAWRTTRDEVIGHLPRGDDRVDGFARGREHLVQAKDQVLRDSATYRSAFAAKATAAGATVHEAPTAQDARDVIRGLLIARGVKLLAKGKSMAAEEVFLNHDLEAAGIRVVETDLGEWIVQLAGETPSHMVMPAIHKSRAQVAELFERATGRPVSRADIPEQVQLARTELRRTFLEADAGLIGANALIAETGTVMLVTNEGNGDLVSSLPKIVIVLAGWEKLLPTMGDAADQLRLLARSATGQEITSYTSFLTGPGADRELHIVLLDNGRSAMQADPEMRDALRCIRCAACADVCPPYQVVGGHVFGFVYSGAIGLVNTPFHHGMEAAAGPQSLCVSCNACASVCPVAIPLPRQILATRARVVERDGMPLPQRIAFSIWQRARLFDAVFRVAALVTRPIRRGPFLRLPLPARWAWRTLPAPALRPARRSLLGQTFPPMATGPWSGSGASGLTVSYFLQCVSDRFAPEQAEAAVEVLRACGARVVVPEPQHCCGLPQLDAGDPVAARRLAKETIVALERGEADYVVSAAASCAIAIMHDYVELLDREPAWRARAERLAARTLDLVSFLRQVADPPVLPPAASESVTYHQFCQSTNVLGLGASGAELLRTAGINVTDLPEAEVCCGFGGSTSFAHPEVSRAIAERKLANVQASGAEVLASDNPGCILHLRGASDAARMSCQSRHLAEVLAARLRLFT